MPDKLYDYADYIKLRLVINLYCSRQRTISISVLRFRILHRRQEFLERNFHENHFSIQDDHNLRLHNLDLPVGKIVTAFVENGLEVSEAHTCEESLEDYFKRVTGGEGIA